MKCRQCGKEIPESSVVVNCYQCDIDELTKPATLEGRVSNYRKSFPKWEPPYIGGDGRIYGIWILGNDYRNAMGYYGEYPPNYLKRVGALFPEIFTVKCLHVFSGSLTQADVGNAKRMDCNPAYKPDIIGDFEAWECKIPEYDVICADPPYSGEDALKYGVPLINRNKAIKACYSALRVGGFVLWLDQVMPMWNKTQFRLAGLIGISRSSNHRFRNLVIFQKLAEGK